MNLIGNGEEDRFIAALTQVSDPALRETIIALHHQLRVHTARPSHAGIDKRVQRLEDWRIEEDKRDVARVARDAALASNRSVIIAYMAVGLAVADLVWRLATH